MAGEDEDFVPKRAEAGLTGWSDCYAKLQEAYEMGKCV